MVENKPFLQAILQGHPYSVVYSDISHPELSASVLDILLKIPPKAIWLNLNIGGDMNHLTN